MAIIKLIDSFKTSMRTIRVKLFPNNLPEGGKYIARADGEETLTNSEILGWMRDRGGYQGSLDHFMEGLSYYFTEIVFQLNSGRGINMGLFHIHVNIGGTFDTESELHDHKKHPITYRVWPQKLLRDQAQHVKVEIVGFGDSGGYITEFIDSQSSALNETYTPGNIFIINGHKLKVSGDDPSCGVYLVSTESSDPPKKVEHLAENAPSKLIGIIPDPGHTNPVRIEIRTQHSGSGKPLKEPRIISSNFTLERS